MTDPARTEQRLRQGLERGAQADCKLAQSVPLATHRVVCPAHSSEPALGGFFIGNEPTYLD